MFLAEQPLVGLQYLGNSGGDRALAVGGQGPGTVVLNGEAGLPAAGMPISLRRFPIQRF